VAETASTGGEAGEARGASAALEEENAEEHVLIGDPGTGPVSFAGDAVAGRREADDTGAARPWPATASAPVPVFSPRAALVARASTLDPAAPIEVVIELRHGLPPFRAATASDETRARLVSDRQDLAAAVTGPIAARLVSLGATNVVEHWLNPKIAARVPAGALASIDAWPEVENLSDNRRESGPASAYGGEEMRNGMRTNAFVSNGLTGLTGSRAGGRIRFGVMEADNGNNWPNRTHAGFYFPGVWPRFIYVGDCRTGSCVASSSTGVDTHGTRVTKILAGSIEAGQDPAITDPVERRRRSGQSSGSYIYYYLVGGTCSSWSAAVEKAVADGIDVLNISATIRCTGSVGDWRCYADCDCGGLNADLESAADSGVLTAAAIGNGRDPGVGTCNAVYPGLRRAGITPAPLHTWPSDVVYDTSVVLDLGARGGMTIRLWDGRLMSGAFAVADLAVPGAFTYWYSTPPFGYNTITVDGGSSLATPAAAGAAGLLREHFSSLGWTPNARVLLVNMLLMGDSYSYDYGGDVRYGMNPRSGAGRAHMHYPASANLTAPWGWGWHVFTITNSSTVSFTVWDIYAESPLVTQWKVAMTWREADYAAAADIVLEVWNTCPAGGGNPVPVTSDMSYDIRKRIELVQSEISNRCLEVRVRTFSNSMPPGQTRTVYVADYFHSGNPADH